MIRLYNSAKFFHADEVVWDNESFFFNVPIQTLSDDSINLMLEIDEAKLLDRTLGTIQTPFGVTDMSNLSTGCKTALNIVYCTENPDAFPKLKAVSLLEAGWNAIDALFDYMDKRNSPLCVILEHNDKIHRCRKHDFLINNETNIQSLFDYWG